MIGRASWVARRNRTTAASFSALVAGGAPDRAPASRAPSAATRVDDPAYAHLLRIASGASVARGNSGNAGGEVTTARRVAAATSTDDAATSTDDAATSTDDAATSTDDAATSTDDAATSTDD